MEMESSWWEGGIDWSLEFAVGVVLGRFADHQTGYFEPQRVWLRRPADEGFAAVLGCDIVFDADRIGLDLDLTTADAPMRLSDPGLHETLTRVAERLALGDSRSALDSAIRARLREMLPHGTVNATRIARLLGMSERTLARRLTDGGTSFRVVLDAFRAEESRRLLLEGRESLATIAERLGYTDQSAWTRAFKRWQGETPSAWISGRRAVKGSA